MESGEKERAETPKDLENDPTLLWAESIAADGSLPGEVMHAHFIELKERYRALLRRLTKIARISDGYQLPLKELNLLLSTDARTDYLTGLSNRRDMLERLDMEISRTHRHGDSFSLIIADIDLFKLINDEHGHEAGDWVIEAVADCFRANLRLEDHCARWGGEEFLMCLTRATLDGALVVAEKLRSGVAGLAVEYRGVVLNPTASFGVAQYTVGENVDDVIRGADRALMEAKKGGRNQVHARRVESARPPNEPIR